MNIREIQEMYRLNLKEISNVTNIAYSRVVKLKNDKVKYSMEDYAKIDTWLEKRGDNVINITFIKRDVRKPYRWEQRGVRCLNEYKREKIREENRIDRRNRQQRITEIYKATKEF